MDQEKEIEEMSIMARKTITAAFGYEYGCRVETAEQQGKNIARVLFDKGYRKSDEVRKETAKEIFQRLYDLTDYARPTILEVAKEYGIKVYQR